MIKILITLFFLTLCSFNLKAQELYHVFFPNSQIGYSSGFHLTEIYKTTDAGETWVSQPPQLGQGEIGALYFWSPDSGVALFSDVAKTTDGGLSWQFHTTGNPYWLFAVDFLDSHSGIAVGVTGKIIKTTDGGEDWNLIDSNIDIPLMDAEYLTPNLILVCGGFFDGTNGIILRSTNGGLNWSSQSLPISTTIRGISFIDDNIGIAVGNDGKIIRSTNGGVSWSEVSSPTTNILWACRFVSSSIAFAVGVGGNIIKSTDGGESWFSLESPTVNTLFDIYMFNESEGIIVGNNTILKTTDGGVNWEQKGVMPDGVNDFTKEILTTYSISQNFPNPFNPTTIINYEIPKSGLVTIKIYDVLGREIETLVNEEKIPGKYKINFDGSKLTSGVYFYKITINNYSETKKMLLMK